MIRLSLLYIFVAVLIIVAVRHWYYSLCGLLFLTVFTQHPSMPTNMAGIQGLNPWNMTLLAILGGCVLNRQPNTARARAPRLIVGMLVAYVLTVALAGIAGIVDASSIRGTRSGASASQWIAVDGIINPLKYLTVGVLFFLGATSRRRIKLALLSSIGSGFCYAILIFKSIGPRIFTIDFVDARRLTDKLVGLFANDVGELFAFTLWAGLFATPILVKSWQRGAWLIGIALVVPPFVAVKSRAGYLVFCVVALVIAALRSRKLFILMPVFVMIVLVIAPSVADRALTGFEDSSNLNWDEISAGRVTNIWPAVIEQISKSPILGHGRYAILREDCYEKIEERERSVPGHPHNSYLEVLLDAGVVGLAICLSWMAYLLVAAGSLMRSRNDALVSAVGAAALAACVAELSAGIAGSSFFPTQSSVPYLCLWGVALRVHLEVRSERARSLQAVRASQIAVARRQPLMGRSVCSS